VDGVGNDYFVVDGTRFFVDDRTRVRPLPGQDPEELGLEPIMSPPEGDGKLWVPYSPRLFEDVSGARVRSTGRRAEEIVLLPYGSLEGDR